MIEVFKTNVQEFSEAQKLVALLRKHFPNSKINFDLDDCDKVLRVEGNNLREIARFVSEKLSSVEGVVSTATRFRLKTYKQNGMLLSQPPSAERLPVTP